MKVLLATPEIEPLTGATPLGVAVDRLARELHCNAGSDVIVALPATDAILREHVAELNDTGAVISAAGGPGEGPSARVLEFRTDDEQPQIYLLDCTELRHGFNETLPAETLATRALLLARFLANLISRLKPRIHIVHCFGWENALLPPLIRTGKLDFKSILTTEPQRGGGPEIAAMKTAVARSGLSELAAIEEEPDNRPLLAWAGRFADRISSLGEGTREDENSREPMTEPSTAIRAKQRARASTLALHDLAENALSTLFYVPTDNPAPLLPFLDRLLDSDARVIVEGRPEDPAIETALLATQMRHPGKLAFIKIESFLAEEQDWYTAADFVLLLPEDADDPESVASVTLALMRGCTPVVPRRDHFDPVLSPSHTTGQPSPAAVFYRTESPEAIWSSLKRCMQLHRNPNLWKEQVGNVVRAGLADEGIAPEFSELYREVIESGLTASA